VAITMIALLAALAAAQGVASADIQITSATLDGATSISTPPGGVVPARVSATLSPPRPQWDSTDVRIGSATDCVDHGKEFGTGSRSTSFDVTAPGAPGSYDAGFTGASDNACRSDRSAEKVLQDAIRVTAPAPNPNLRPVCGIDVMLVLDESTSIETSGATDTVRAAARAFLTGLSGTGSTVGIVDFSTNAALAVPYTTVTTNSIATVFNPYLQNGYRPNGWTNWEAAFQRVRQANAVQGGTRADLVIFITDGDPTAHNRASGSPITGLTEGDYTALTRAAAEADLVKGQGSHVLAIGVGSAVTKPTSERRLTAISGFQRYPDQQPDLGKGDYALVEDIGDLPAALRALALALCKGSVTVTKLVDEGDGTFHPDPGWSITADVDTSSGSYDWVQPPPARPPGPRTDVTGDHGTAKFQWKPDNSTASSTVTITEAAKPGYTLVDWTCTTSSPGRSRGRSASGATATITTTLGPNEYATCTLRNRIVPGTIEIEKAASPQSPQAFDFTGSAPLGAFALIDDGGAGPSSRTFTGLVPGTYTVSETVPADWELQEITCSDPAVTISGTQVTIPLASGDAIVCRYADRRVDPPAPPVPPVPPDPDTSGGGNPPAPPTPVPPPPSTRLKVVKVAPNVARVGDRVPFDLRVTNVGSITATNVRLLDVPPAAMTLSGLNASSTARRVRGNGVWRLGTIAPGATKVVRGTVRITSATPGRKRNTAVATANNARLALAATDTRVLARRAVAPAVTG
jgi:uncharacterized repeat protein (TIGR01451 family)